PAVERIDGRDDFETAFVVAEFPRQLEQAFVSLNAAVAEKYFARPDFANQRLRKFPLRPVIVKIRGMDELARLLNQRFGDGRGRVAERQHGDAAAEVQVALARHVPNLAAGTM